MRVFHEPVKNIFAPKKPKLPEPAVDPEADKAANAKADEEAGRRARAAAAGSSRASSILTGGALAPSVTQRRSLLGS